MAKYVNRGGQPRKKCMIAAYTLVNNFGANQKAVASVMGCSQATVSNWVKEVSYKKEISGLKGELESAKEYTEQLAEKLRLIGFYPDDER